MGPVIIRCDFCHGILNRKRTVTDPLTGETTIYVDECKTCIDDAYDDGFIAGSDGYDE